jgi:hypothetical protein
MPELVPTLPDLVRSAENPVHRPDRAEVAPLVEQGGVDLGRGLVDEALAMECGEDRLALRRGEGPPRRGAGPTRGRPAGVTATVQPCATDPRGPTCCGQPHRGPQLLRGGHHALPPLAGVFRGIPRSAETFGGPR